MRNFYYIIDGEDIAVLSSENQQILPVKSDLSADLVTQIESIAVYFDVFDDTYQDSINQKSNLQESTSQKIKKNMLY